MVGTAQGNSSTLVKCDHADICHEDCPHATSHEWTPGCCTSECRWSVRHGDEPVGCVPVGESDEDYYKDMWLRLRCELQTLQTNGCRNLDPVMALRFMDYIEMVEESKCKPQ